MALIEGIATAKGKDYAVALVNLAGSAARKASEDIMAKHGTDSIYVMQVVGEVLIWTVYDTLQKLLADRKH